MANDLHVVAIVNDEDGTIRANKLPGPLANGMAPVTVVPLGGSPVSVHIWWINGMPPQEVQETAYLQVLSYLHDLLLESSVTNPSLRGTVSALAQAILDASGVSDPDEN